MINDYRNANFPFVTPWATTSGRKVEPTEGEVASGFNASKKLPATKLNWALDRFTNAAAMVTKRAVSDFTVEQSPVETILGTGSLRRCIGAACYNMAFDEASGANDRYWVAMLSDGASFNSQFAWSRDGISWNAGAPMPTGFPGSAALEPLNACVITSGEYAVTASGSGSIGLNIFYTADVRDSGTDAIAQLINASTSLAASSLAVERDGNRLMLGDDNGSVHTGVVGSSWVSRSLALGESIESICHVQSTTWAALTNTGKVYVTTNSGYVWALSHDLGAVGEIAAGFTQFMSLEIGLSGRAVVTARESASLTGMYVFVSDDLINWGEAVYAGARYTERFYAADAHAKAISLGGSIWLIAGTSFTNGATRQFQILVSVDDGETWSLGNQLRDSGSATDDALGPMSVSYDGSRLLAVGTYNMLRGVANEV